MKREEFIKEIEGLGFYVDVWEVEIQIMDKFNKGLGMIREKYTHRLDTDYDNLSHLKDDEKIKLFELMTEYAKTPIEER